MRSFSFLTVVLTGHEYFFSFRLKKQPEFSAWNLNLWMTLITPVNFVEISPSGLGGDGI